MELYERLTDWYLLLDPRDEHADEGAYFSEAFQTALGARGGTLLEIGSGAGNNASYLKAHFECTLVDPSPQMRTLSLLQNPECEHVDGDMRTVRLDRTFDAVLIHNAIVYMRTEADLRACMDTAFAHLRPGGVAVFAPDCTRESFHECTEVDENSDGSRSLRYLAWCWDPDPDDTTYTVDYASYTTATSRASSRTPPGSASWKPPDFRSSA
jgi:SAM-dependent methyltransferase